MEKFYTRNRQKPTPKYQDCLEKLYQEGKITYDPANFTRPVLQEVPPDYPPPPPPVEPVEPTSVLSSDQYYPPENLTAQVITDKHRYPVGSIQDYYEPKYAQIRAVRSPGNVQHKNDSRNSYYDTQFDPPESSGYQREPESHYGIYTGGDSRHGKNRQTKISPRSEGTYCINNINNNPPQNASNNQTNSPRNSQPGDLYAERKHDNARRNRRHSRESFDERYDVSKAHFPNFDQSGYSAIVLNHGSSVESMVSSHSASPRWIEQNNAEVQRHSSNNSPSYYPPRKHASRSSQDDSNSPRYHQTPSREHSNSRRSSDQLHSSNHRNPVRQYSDSRRTSWEERSTSSHFYQQNSSKEHSNRPRIRKSSREEPIFHQQSQLNSPSGVPPNEDNRYQGRSHESGNKPQPNENEVYDQHRKRVPSHFEQPAYPNRVPQYRHTSSNENLGSNRHSANNDTCDIPFQPESYPSHFNPPVQSLTIPPMSNNQNCPKITEMDFETIGSSRANVEIDDNDENMQREIVSKNVFIESIAASNSKPAVPEKLSSEECDSKHRAAEDFAGRYIEKFTRRYERVGADSYRKSDLEKTDEYKARNASSEMATDANGATKYQRSLSMDEQSNMAPTTHLRRSSTNPFLDMQLDDIDMSSIPYAPHKFLPDEKENLVTPEIDEDVTPPPPPRKFSDAIPVGESAGEACSTVAADLPSECKRESSKTHNKRGKFEHKVKRKLKAKKLLSKDDGGRQILEHPKSLPELHAQGYIHPKSMTLPRRAIQTDGNYTDDSEEDVPSQPLNSNPFLHGSLPLLDQISNSDAQPRNMTNDNHDEEETLNSTKLDTSLKPRVVLRQLKLLLETSKYPEAEAFVDRLSRNNFTEILPNLALDNVLVHFPKCLPFLCVVLDKIDLISYPADYVEFPIKNLNMDVLMKEIVKYFADKPMQTPINFDENVRNVLKVVAHFNPKLKSAIYKRKRTLEQCLTGLAKHGFVAKPDGKLVQLHEAFRTELSKQLQLCKTTLPKVDDLLPKTPTKSSQKSSKYAANSHSLPPEAGHQRMLNFTHREVEDRLIKNRALSSALEGFGSSSGYLSKLNMELDERIQCDKYILLHYNELRKQMKIPSKSACMSPHLQRYALAFTKVLEYFPNAEDGDCDYEVFDDKWSDMDVETLDTASCSSLSVSRHGKASVSSVAPSLRSNHNKRYSALDINKQIEANGIGVNSESSMSTLTMAEQTDVETLQNEVFLLKKELHKARNLNEKLETREKLLKERLSEKAQHNVQCGSTFEDLNLGDSRPTQLIRRYSNLYSQARVDALDALDSNVEISEFDDLKVKLLFSVVVLAFRAAQEALDEMKCSIQQLLYLPVAGEDLPENHNDAAQEMEENILVYLRKTTEQFDHSKIIDSVGKQLWATLYDYPSLRQLEPLLTYIEECAHVAWALIIQNPPFVLDYESTIYDDNHHTRFFLSDAESAYIKTFLWPTLLEHENGPCVFKGVVVT